MLQIAAHEEAFGLERLYDLCRIARRLCDPLNIGRVIARPFVGDRPARFHPHPHRKDFVMPPPHGTILTARGTRGRAIVSIGKIGDIFAHRDTGAEMKARRQHGPFRRMPVETLKSLPDGGFIFANLVDFDTEWGHRRDVPGYAARSKRFDARLPRIEAALRPDDLCVITADHGNDPTWTGIDHTREHVPLLAFGAGVAPRALGSRKTFADIGASVAHHLGLAPTKAGAPWQLDQ